MAETDVRVLSTEVRFRDVVLDPPLSLSGGKIDRVTVAGVTAEVESRNGSRATGYGESVLSVLWSWPRSSLSIDSRDAVLRALVAHHARAVTRGEAADPVEIWAQEAASLDGLLRTAERSEGEVVPRLASLLALGAVDNALHDAWARCAGKDAFDMYTAEHLSRDLSRYGFPGVYPADGLAVETRRSLPVQHLVGVADALQSAGTERGLADWIATEGVDRLKIKTASIDPQADAARISEVYRVAREAGVDPRLSVDPNEGYSDISLLGEMLDALHQNNPAAASRIEYIEQPTPRGKAVDAEAFRAVSRRVPIVLDEGFTRLSELSHLHQEGWSGIVVKAGKGQSPAVIAAAIGRALGMYVVVQDLTTTGISFAHSARLAARLDVSNIQLEYNSRQYAPAGNDALAELAPRLARIAGGAISLDELSGGGLHGLPSDADLSLLQR